MTHRHFRMEHRRRRHRRYRSVESSSIGQLIDTYITWNVLHLSDVTNDDNQLKSTKYETAVMICNAQLINCNNFNHLLIEYDRFETNLKQRFHSSSNDQQQMNNGQNENLNLNEKMRIDKLIQVLNPLTIAIQVNDFEETCPTCEQDFDSIPKCTESHIKQMELVIKTTIDLIRQLPSFETIMTFNEQKILLKNNIILVMLFRSIAIEYPKSQWHQCSLSSTTKMTYIMEQFTILRTEFCNLFNEDDHNNNILFYLVW